ncbi:SPOR domain-containing protein [Pelomonas sp. BJYL3]|uniref:SPOR domain-containing protein n=1 Tax=Pelomonas sp. BJYL3 TaxID=2976697 RepID=UPI0022B38DE2|nr:SPOR domain-containing protein [Pelomonas sp. BJYL3]
MGLLSFFKRAEDNKTAAKPVAEGLDAVQQLRLRARRRLIGAAVLVAAGVIAFPLVFETQPRPVPVDLPIEIPKKDGLPPLSVPVATAPVASAERHAAAPAEQGTGIVNEVPAPVAEPVKPTEAPRQDTHPEARKEAASKPEPKVEPRPEPRKPADKAPEKPQDKAAAKPAEKPAEKATEKPQDKAHARPQSEREADAARAQALLEGREPPKPADKKPDAVAGARFIVQVGAFAEAKAAQDVRGKVEKLGLKTYTQAIETPDGKRIRVRVGPFASREEADRAAAKLRGGGLSGTVLTL